MLIKGRNEKSTVCIARIEEETENYRIKMNDITQRMLNVRTGDQISVHSAAEVKDNYIKDLLETVNMNYADPSTALLKANDDQGIGRLGISQQYMNALEFEKYEELIQRLQANED